MRVWDEGNRDRWDTTEGLVMFEIHWYDCHGSSYSVADDWKEMHELVSWLQARGAVVTGIIKVK